MNSPGLKVRSSSESWSLEILSLSLSLSLSMTDFITKGGEGLSDSGNIRHSALLNSPEFSELGWIIPDVFSMSMEQLVIAAYSFPCLINSARL